MDSNQEHQISDDEMEFDKETDDPELQRFNQNLKDQMKKIKISMYSQDQVMEYFNRRSIDFYRRDKKELQITNGFGFVQDTIKIDDDRSTATSCDQFQPLRLSDSAPKVDNKQLKQENARMKKWVQMLQTDPHMKNYNKYKKRVRKGIPQSVRGYAWKILSKSDQQLTQQSDPSEYYQSLLKQQGNHEVIRTIFKDVTRTFTDHVFFRDEFGQGQKTLFCVLKALSIHDQEIGYVQGMGYISAMLLTQLDEEDTFKCSLTIMNKHEFRDNFKDKMPGLAKSFYIHLSLLKKFMPKIHAHFLQNYMIPQIYATQWYMTLFASSLPYECILKIWDIYLVEGTKIIYRVCLALIKLISPNMLQMGMDELYSGLKQLQNTIDADTLIKTAMSFKFTNSVLKKIEQKYTNKPDKDILQHCVMS
ncbi:plant adhesion molecule 1 [Stylonychia lemnae]|uniref:Plant adhesion molecule 1 n=1 Tax=Stylonychia lemnae TaxID=5949 RepID=A0A078BB98_STYLE|nr:plant adhesion molecule 1 [Stylonychia lemnae]|eukprot:CDW90532.1 plant adhesion molecule 1 [Stylonychia lemnae]